MFFSEYNYVKAIALEKDPWSEKKKMPFQEVVGGKVFNLYKRNRQGVKLKRDTFLKALFSRVSYQVIFLQKYITYINCAL